MSNEALDKFGELFVKFGRDNAIRRWYAIIDGKMGGIWAEEIRKLLEGLSPEAIQALRDVTPHLVDSVLTNLMYGLEESEDVNVSVRLQDGHIIKDLSEVSDGLAGELYSEAGWIARFSEYPTIDENL